MTYIPYLETFFFSRYPSVWPWPVIILVTRVRPHWHYYTSTGLGDADNAQWNGEWSLFAGRRPTLGHGVPGRRPALACSGGTECRPKACTGGTECPAEGRHWPALGALGARSARPKAGTGLHWGHEGAGRRPTLGHGVPGRRPALHSSFGHCLHLGLSLSLYRPPLVFAPPSLP